MAESSAPSIARRLVAEDRRVGHADDVFGAHFPLRVEPLVFDLARRLCAAYDGGYWEFYALGNGGFYMAPAPDRAVRAVCENRFEGELSADAFGIVACLHAYSALSFSGVEGFAETCAWQYHWVRDFALEHPEARAILAAID